jgi:hypothetical protein
MWVRPVVQEQPRRAQGREPVPVLRQPAPRKNLPAREQLQLVQRQEPVLVLRKNPLARVQRREPE